MKQLALILLISLPLMGQSMGGGALGNGALGSGALGSGALGTLHDYVSDDCMPEALVDYDSRTLTSAGTFSTLANMGSGGSGWDITQATTADQPVAMLSCQNGLPCTSFTDTTDKLQQAVSQSVSWTKTIICWSASQPADGGSSAWLAWDNTGVAVKNSLLDRSTAQNVVGDVGAVALPAFPSGGWQSGCIDFTDPTAPESSYNGAAAVAIGTLTTAPDPNQISIGIDWNGTSGWDWATGKLGRAVIYNVDTGLTISDLSACMASQWGT